MAIDKIFNDANVDGIADNIFGAVNNSVSEVKAMQQRKAAENVQMVVEAFKKIETNITEKFDNVTDVIEKRVLTIKDGRDGSSGSDGRNGRDGKPGRDGVNGKQGPPGTPGKDGVDGEDGVSVTNANIDFDGSLVISLSSGQQINVGEVVAPDLAEKIKIVSTMSTNGAVGIKDEGSSISTGVKNINFVGATVTATASGDDVTVNVSAGTGTVQSVAATVPAFLSVAGSPITTTGTLAISLSGTALPVANGGTGITSFGTGVATALGVNTGTAGAFVVNGGALGTPSSGTVTNLTGTASININGTVGATTPGTGAFTTVSATGTITQTGSSGNVSFNQNQTITAAIVNTKTAVGANSLGAYDQFVTKDNTGTTNTWAVGVNVNSANSSWELYNGGTRFSITQAGVVSIGGNTAVTGTLSATGNTGIGTTAGASTRLTVTTTSGSLATFTQTGATGYGLTIVPGADTVYDAFTINNAANTLNKIRMFGDGSATFAGTLSGGTSGTAYSFSGSAPATSLTLDASGNLGLNVTPSAWSSVYKALEIGTVGNNVYGGASSNSETGMVSAAYYNSGWKYSNTGSKPIRFSMNDVVAGQSEWYTAAAGTAGNPISFTQAMTLDADGRLGIGTTTPLKFNTSGSASAKLLTVFNSGTNSGTRGEFQIGNASTTSGDTTGLIMFGCGASTTTANSTAIIYSELTASSTSVAYGALVFGTANGAGATERARIDSSGNLIVGASSAFDGTYRGIQAINTTGGDCAVFTTTGVSGNIVRWNKATSGDNLFIDFYTETSITARGGISYNRAGGLVAYNVTSDYRAKDIYGLVTNSGALIDSVPVYMGKMKDATQERPMFLAHETPIYAHTGEKDAVDKDGKPVYQQMDASALIPVMWAELQSLRARVAQLESKP